MYANIWIVGPAALRSLPLDRSLRYPSKLFSVSSPQYYTSSPGSQVVHNCLRQINTNAIAKSLGEVSTKVEPKKKRSVGGQVGFFEQAIFTGLGMFGTATVLSVGVLGYVGVRFALNLRK
jgi:hypothetical protein